MHGPKTVCRTLMRQIKKANGADVTIPWQDFYAAAGMSDGYITPDYMDRVNIILKPKGYVSVKNNNGVLIRHLH